MRKFQLAFLVVFGYVWALWFNQADLHSSVSIVLPLWFALALRAASYYGLLVYLAYYLPSVRLWLLGLVRQVVESEHWDV